MTLDPPGERESATFIILAILFEGALAPLAVFLGWLFDRPALAGFTWNLEDATIGAIAAVPLFVMFLLGRIWPVGPFRSVKAFFDEEATPILVWCRWPDLVLISLAAGVGEEMLFRGVAQGVLGRWFGVWTGVGVASVLFGLLHLITPGYILISSVMGVYLGVVYLYNGNLLTVIVAHAVYDFAALVLLLRERPSRSS
jgi:membrane protease YdiL (CAAX protease family)